MVEEKSRTQIAFEEKGESVRKYLSQSNIAFDNFQIKLVALKKEQILKVYAKDTDGSDYQKIVSYDFCTFSGDLGPKLKEGDKQIPEGFYFIDRFNERSKFYLSLGLNYPNHEDMKIADQHKPGKDIFIHGGCSSVGCIAITDEKIKELYVLAESSQKPIEVIILPFENTAQNFEEQVLAFPQWKNFWTELFAKYSSIESTFSD